MLESTRQLANALSGPEDKTATTKNVDDSNSNDTSTKSGSMTSHHVYKKRLALSKAITLVESKLPRHQEQANLLLHHLMLQRDGDDNKHAHTSSFRLGIAGPPGAGKSTLIETFGTQLLENTLPKTEDDSDDDASGGTTSKSDPIHKLAVVCIDPSSTVTGGSILGDKTRMMHLSSHPRAYVRPSANGGTFGGLAAYTDDVVSLCQAAHYDAVWIETVGLGQSEVEVSKSVDMLILILPPSGGDELQGVKKGIMEVADLIVVNKADGALLPAARRTAADYMSATNFLTHQYGRTPPVIMVSSETKDGFAELWSEICKFRQFMTQEGHLQKKRKDQAHYWMWKNLQNIIAARTKSNEQLQKTAAEMQQRLDRGQITPRVAANQLLDSLLAQH
jgi:LAO/AO transport system kinase